MKHVCMFKYLQNPQFVNESPSTTSLVSSITLENHTSKIISRKYRKNVQGPLRICVSSALKMKLTKECLAKKHAFLIVFRIVLEIFGRFVYFMTIFVWSTPYAHFLPRLFVFCFVIRLRKCAIFRLQAIGNIQIFKYSNIQYHIQPTKCVAIRYAYKYFLISILFALLFFS